MLSQKRVLCLTLDIPVKQEGVDYYTQLQKLCWKLHVHIEKSDRYTPSALIEKLQEWYDNRMADRRADKMAGTSRISMWCTGISVVAVVVTLFVTLFQSHHVHEPPVNHVHEPSEPTKQFQENDADEPKEPPPPVKVEVPVPNSPPVIN